MKLSYAFEAAQVCFLGRLIFLRGWPAALTLGQAHAIIPLICLAALRNTTKLSIIMGFASKVALVSKVCGLSQKS